MPYGILNGKPHTGFRSGKWSYGTSDNLFVRFDAPWDLSKVKNVFPMSSSVVPGKLSETAAKMPAQTLAWEGHLSRADSPWSVAKEKVAVGESTVVAKDHGVRVPESPYKSRFRDGAIIYPLVLTFVTEAPSGSISAGAGRRSVVSTRSVHQPWKACTPLSGNIESAFVRPVYLGESTLPFRVVTPREAVLPVTNKGIFAPDEIELHDGLSTWWSTAESAWEKYKAKSEKRTFLERLNHHGQLAAQFPVSPVRIVFTKTGTSLASAIVRDDDAIIDHSLYWMPVMVEAEAHYLTAIFNSAPLLNKVKPLQAIGLYGPRHFDKNVFAVPFPTYDNTQSIHVDLAALGKEAETEAATVDLSGAKTFQAARKLIREHLATTGLEQKIVDLVAELLLANTAASHKATNAVR